MKRKNMIKKSLVWLLSITTCVSVLAGCGSKEDADNKTGSNKITIGVPQNANVENYETNAYTLWLEETTGYDLSFEYFASTTADNQTQIATRVAAKKELPDILWGVQLGQNVYESYGDDGVFLDLTPYFEDEEKSATFWDRFKTTFPDEKEQELIMNRIKSKENGKMYVFPGLEKYVIDAVPYQVYINQTWLDKLGLAMPNSADSLYQVLKAFSTKDPNGNNKSDEIPLLALADDSLVGSHGINWLTSFFTGTSTKNWYNVDENGTVYMPWVTDEYREALVYIKKLQDEGLLPVSCWSMSKTDMKNLINPTDGVNKVGVFVGHPTVVLEENNAANLEYEALPLWGTAYANESPVRTTCFITKDCENPDAAWDILMAMCSEEGAMRQRYGEKGVDWVEADPGATSFLGIEAEIKVLKEVWDAQNNQIWGSINATILTNPENEARQVGDEDSEWAQHKMKIMKDSYNSWLSAMTNKPIVIVPTLQKTTEEDELTKVERANCSKLITSKRAAFCCGTGGADPTNDVLWADYIREMETMGEDKWTTQMQKLYDETLK